MNGLFDKMSPEDMARVMAILQRQPAPEPMLTGENPFPKFDFSPMLADAGSLIDPAKMKGTGVLDAGGEYTGPKAPAAQKAGYRLGKETPEEIAFRKEQEAAAIAPGRNDLYYKNAMIAWKGKMPDSEIIKRADAKRASKKAPIFP
jgi:hypothetical protein